MYIGFAEKNGWATDIVSANESDLGGYKEVILHITGQLVYAKMKFESGGHRVQRIPTTESQGRIHTSACTVAVLPEADETAKTLINTTDLRIDTFRASGAGGQHINKTDSAIRITHRPTSIVVQCQSDRSQHRNREEAMKLLRARLYDLALRKQHEKKQVLENNKTEVGWGYQIRSYVFDQSRIKDLRTGYEVGNIKAVMDGDLDGFIEKSLMAKV